MNHPSSKSSARIKKHPVFNGKYHIISSLGEGNTSKVYLIESIEEPKKQYALKLIRDEFLKRDSDSIVSVEQEIQILKSISHGNVINCVGYGTDGHVQKPSGRIIDRLVYIMLEFVSGGLLFDLCQTVGGMGEDGGRFFLRQLIDVLEHIHEKGIVHRDLKLENILVDDKLNLKVADFGFATYKRIDKLRSYRGTMTYMAPEIKEGKVYNGKQIDMFSTGVILFIIVNGIFPFKEAKRDEYFYRLLLKGNYEQYWKKVGAQHLSDEFKELMQAFFSADGSKRPTLAQLKEHPWLKKPFSVKITRSNILEKLHTIRCERTTESSSKDGNCRGGEPMLELLRQESALDFMAFNDMTDFEIDVAPGELWEALQEFNVDFFEGQLAMEANVEKKCLKLELENPIEVEPAEASKFAKESDDDRITLDPLQVKVKFFGRAPSEDDEEADEEEMDPRYRVRFVLKRGSQADWYELLAKIQETMDLLLPTKKHQMEMSLLAEIDEEPDFSRAGSHVSGMSLKHQKEQKEENNSSTASDRAGSVSSV